MPFFSKKKSDPTDPAETDYVSEEKDTESADDYGFEDEMSGDVKKIDRDDSEIDLSVPKDGQTGIVIHRYPREYMDAADIYINSAKQEEYYFNIEKTLRVHHLGFIWKIIPNGLKESIQDWIWDKDWLHDIAIKQHEKCERLNSLSAKGQLAYDIRQIAIKVFATLGIVVGILGYRTLVYIPNRTFNDAIAYMNNRQYSEAIVLFEELGSKKYANIYVGLCKAHLAMSEKRFDDAESLYTALIDYASYIGVDNMDEYRKEAVYQKAIAYYNAGEWEMAIETIVPVIKYSNAVEYYERCEYKLADLDYEAGDYYASLQKFALISSYSDAQERMNNIMSSIYTQGLELYNLQSYMEAASVFNSIVDYNYLDCKQMSTQCFYKSAQDEFDDANYLEAIDLFEQIPNYKDSQTMIKECLYKLISSSDYSDNIVSLLSLNGYRDSEQILKSTPYNVYAEWQIIEINGAAANNETFIFNTEGEFLSSETRLPNVAVSTDELSYIYTWDGEKFVTQDNKYEIFITEYTETDYSSSVRTRITLECVCGENQSTYQCQKINELDAYYDSTVVVNTVDTSDYELIQMYLDAMDQLDSSPSVDNENVEESDSNTDDIVDGNEEGDSSNDDSKLLKSFSGEVTKVYEDAFMIEPAEDSDESEIAGKFIVLYEYSRELEIGDTVEVQYREEINTEAVPNEITSYRVVYIESAESEETTVSADSDA